MKSKTIIIDNVLLEDEINFLVNEMGNFSLKKEESKDLRFSFIENYTIDSIPNNPYQKLIEFAKNYFDLTDMVLYEYWFNNRSRTGDWHQDFNTELFHSSHEKKFPLCGIVFYPLVENVKGGELLTETGITIQPVRNRLILFSGNLSHYVKEFQGDRCSLSINPFDKIDTTPRSKKLINFLKNLS
jgi:hypothetical protein